MLEATWEGFDAAPSYAWSKDGADLGVSLATLNVGSVVEEDAGTYTVEAEGTVEGDPATAEEGHQVVVYEVGEAPLAGGLGLGLMAGACALAGAVAIRRKK